MVYLLAGEEHDHTQEQKNNGIRSFFHFLQVNLIANLLFLIEAKNNLLIFGL